MKPEIQLRSGLRYNFLDPENCQIPIPDMAFALSNICRYTGHTEFYSVAQHSVIVSRIVPKSMALEGLLHDGIESVMNDMSGPLKILFPEYKKLEHKLEAILFAQMGIKFPFPPEVKRADIVARLTEKRDLLVHSEHVNWTPEIDGLEPSPTVIRPVPPDIAYQMFLDRYWELTGRHYHVPYYKGFMPAITPSRFTVEEISKEIVEALLSDEHNGGYDLTAGMFGPAFSAFIRRLTLSQVR